jgi:phosphoribosylformylglycinamidine synthase
MKPPILILHARGTNRDREAAWACELAGGAPEIVHVNQLIAGQRRLMDYRMLVLPGGFSYGDGLGAGKLLAITLRYRLADELAAFIEAGRSVLGICNGFQALVKSALLPGISDEGRGTKDESPLSNLQPPDQVVTLARNDSARFECRWVYLQPQPASPLDWPSKTGCLSWRSGQGGPCAWLQDRLAQGQPVRLHPRRRD